MPIIIQDDFYEAASQLPLEQAKEFIFAVTVYGFDGTEPEDNEPWFPMFTLIKGRIDLSKKRAGAGKSGGKSTVSRKQNSSKNNFASTSLRKQNSSKNNFASTSLRKQNPSKNNFASEQSCKQNDSLLQKQNENLLTRVESEKEKEKEITPLNPPLGEEGEKANFAKQDFPLLCLAVLNEELGTTFSEMPSECRQRLARSDGEVALSDIRSMVAYKRDSWRETKFAKCLTPNTLFSPAHFEQYLHESKTHAEEVGSYDNYDL